MKKRFTLIIMCVLSLTMAQSQIFDYVTWGEKSEGSTEVDVWLYNDVKLFNYTKFGASYIQFKSSDLGAVTGESNQGYLVFPAKDLSGYGANLKATIALSVKVAGSWSGDFDLLVSDNYQVDDPVGTAWETVSSNMASSKVWGDIWTDREVAEIEFTNPGYANAVFAIRVHDTNSNNKAARIYTVKLVDPLATSISSEWAQSICVYPNPATDVLRITGVSFDTQVSVCNASGRLVLQKTQLASNELNVASLSKGVYLLIVEEGQNRTVQKFIKK